jgi:hypothetical protein
MRVKGMGIMYATREDVKNALDAKETARNNAQIDRAIEGASRAVERICHRMFYPTTDTRYFDWPDDRSSRSWRLWLDEDELLSVTSITSGGTTIAATDYFLYPANSSPKDHVEIDLSSAADFETGDTHQRNIVITGVFGYTTDTEASTTLAEALDATETGVDIAASTTVGVGSIIKVDSEWMTVTGRALLTTGTTLTADVASSVAVVTIPVSSGTGYLAGEVVQVDSEKLLVVDVAGNNLTVKRAWDGSALASHLSGATVYAPRTLTVVRGALGSTAATHLTEAPVSILAVPALIRTYVIARSVAQIAREVGGYTSDASKASAGLNDLRMEVETLYGRLRMGAM